MVVGGIGFHGPPTRNVVEVGYGVARGVRGRGVATQALLSLLDVAAGLEGVQRVVGRTEEIQRGLAAGDAGGRHAVRGPRPGVPALPDRPPPVTADVGAAADELYGLPAQEFTGARDRMAADIRRAGDRDLAAAVKKLRRPTATAWFANQLVRHYPQQVAELLDTGAALRRAQADLDVDGLRHQTQAGQQLIRVLARQARQLAADTGQSLCLLHRSGTDRCEPPPGGPARPLP